MCFGFLGCLRFSVVLLRILGCEFGFLGFGLLSGFGFGLLFGFWILAYALGFVLWKWFALSGLVCLFGSFWVFDFVILF